jgi:hypothetical protein
VAARLEIEVERGPARAVSRIANRLDLCVGKSRAPVIPFTDDPVSLDDDGPDERIRKRLAKPLFGELERAAYVRLIPIHSFLLREKTAASGPVCKGRSRISEMPRLN